MKICNKKNEIADTEMISTLRRKKKMLRRREGKEEKDKREGEMCSKQTMMKRGHRKVTGKTKRKEEKERGQRR